MTAAMTNQQHQVLKILAYAVTPLDAHDVAQEFNAKELGRGTYNYDRAHEILARLVKRGLVARSKQKHPRWRLEPSHWFYTITDAGSEARL